VKVHACGKMMAKEEEAQIEGGSNTGKGASRVEKIREGCRREGTRPGILTREESLTRGGKRWASVALIWRVQSARVVLALGGRVGKKKGSPASKRSKKVSLSLAKLRVGGGLGVHFI